mgnify:CR=1 FL=1
MGCQLEAKCRQKRERVTSGTRQGAACCKQMANSWGMGLPKASPSLTHSHDPPLEVMIGIHHHWHGQGLGGEVGSRDTQLLPCPQHHQHSAQGQPWSDRPSTLGAHAASFCCTDSCWHYA